MNLRPTLLASFCILTQAAHASDLKMVRKADFIHVEIGSDDDGLTSRNWRGNGEDMREMSRRNQDLRRRVRLLEQAVLQLQDQMLYLSQRYPSADPNSENSGRYACSITTGFHGTKVATGTTKIEATAKTLQACEASGEAFCPENQVKCERAD